MGGRHRGSGQLGRKCPTCPQLKQECWVCCPRGGAGAPLPGLRLRGRNSVQVISQPLKSILGTLPTWARISIWCWLFSFEATGGGVENDWEFSLETCLDIGVASSRNPEDKDDHI